MIISYNILFMNLFNQFIEIQVNLNNHKEFLKDKIQM